MIEKEFVPYEEALALKELGFNKPCLASYYHAGKRLDICEYINHGEYTVLAPTFSQAFRFFREKYNIHSYIDELKKYNKKLVYDFVIVSDDDEEYEDNRRWKTYEEAQLECLKELIEIVKEQTQ